MSSFLPSNKILVGERIKLVPFHEDFLTERYVSWLNDPEVVRLSDQRFRHHTLASCREYFMSYQDTPNWFWGIETVEDQQHIGNINAYVDSVHSVADIGIVVGEKDYWGKGIATEAYRLAMDFLFRDIQIRKITVGTLAVNTGMIHVMEKLGLKPDGVRVKQSLFEGQEVDMIHMAMFRNEYIKQEHE
jgi:RimJ/RimL family protein N-acetyltransferase